MLPPEAVPLSAAARAYNLQLQRVDTLRGQLAQLDALAQQQRTERQRRLLPLQQRERAARRAWALALDAQLAQEDALGPRHRGAATALLCEHAQALAEAGEADMATLHDRHSRDTLAHKRQAAAQAVRQQLEALLGAPLQGAPADASVQDLWHAAHTQWHGERDAAREKKQARAQARQARRPASAAAQQQAEQQSDADTQLRRLFRQLASALHPDREPDEALRRHKTELMSEANAAYERKDLVTLMQVQQRAALVPPDAVARTPDDKLTALTLLLKQQVAELERERAARQRDLALEHRLPEGVSANAASLQAHLQAQVQALQIQVAELEAGLAQACDLAGLKRWLNRRMG